ncbi:MAG: hypothetical protein E7425_10475 [Ruminococcaceae bacterium]|nr:hypothetical protein [Oscillospiraceae bacterium]
MSPVKTTYRFSKNLDTSVLSWYDVHFPASTFHGRIHIGRMKDDGCGVRRLFTGERDAVRDFLANMHVSDKLDYYITANTVSGVERNLEGLFSLDNIVLDVDCHDADAPWQEQLLPLVWRFKRDAVVPLPNSIVRTGRGVQFWWHIRPVSVKCRPYFTEVRDFLIERLRDFLAEYSEFGAFQVDAAASHNLVGYYRLPGTVNTKAGTRVEFELLRDEEYLLQDMTAWMALEKAERAPKKKPPRGGEGEDFSGRYLASDVRLLRDYHTLGFFRMRQLVQLRILRGCDAGNETRNNLCFMAYNAMLPALGHERAFEKLRDFNAGFRAPMTERELEGVICSARAKGGYRYTNEKMIEFLEITPEEQKAIGLWAVSEPFDPMARLSSHPSRRAAARTARDDRDAKVLALANRGLRMAAIAAELQITRQTVSTILSAHGFDRRRLVVNAVSEGKSIEEAAERAGVSAYTAKKILREQNVKNSSYI